ncbi:tRNA (guanosine(37)-N1)-methyltransferase TrmD [Candidatus Dependentiae bacterium]
MKVSILTVFPAFYNEFLSTSLVKLAQDRGLVEFNFVEFASLCQPGKRIDEPTVGPGPGMILKPEIVEKAIEKCEKEHGFGLKIFFSPQGQKLSQPIFRQFSELLQVEPCEEDKNSGSGGNAKHIILVCARYEGIDARVEEEFADFVFSIGDYVLMGGDLPAQVFLEGLLRLLPGVLGNEESAKTESFETPFFDHPEYGLPVEWKGEKIPDVVQSGHHKEIALWRKKEAAEKTLLNRFDWFRSQDEISKNDLDLAKSIIPPHYVVLMHGRVVVKGKNCSTTSVASLDLHDIARACATFGVKNFFVVTPLLDQQSIVKEFISFWTDESGKKFNYSRFQAVSKLILCSSLDEVKERIRAQDGDLPLMITTSAKQHDHEKVITYNDQGRVWKEKKPILMVIGTGQGLEEDLVQESDFLLTSIDGMSDYNHLSVRAATGIILDRWLGLQPQRRVLGAKKL